jgi:hypothetical protein
MYSWQQAGLNKACVHWVLETQLLEPQAPPEALYSHQDLLGHSLLELHAAVLQIK